MAVYGDSLVQMGWYQNNALQYARRLQLFPAFCRLFMESFSPNRFEWKYSAIGSPVQVITKICLTEFITKINYKK